MTQILCEAPSPDDALTCDQEIGHFGWHSADAFQWFGDEWAVSEFDETVAGPTMSNPKQEWHGWGPGENPRFRGAPKPTQAFRPMEPTRLAAKASPIVPRPQSSWGKVAGIAVSVVAICYFAAVDLVNKDHAPLPVPAKPNCAMKWIDATPEHKLCDDSPDASLTADQGLAKYCIGMDMGHVCNRSDAGPPAIILAGTQTLTTTALVYPTKTVTATVTATAVTTVTLAPASPPEYCSACGPGWSPQVGNPGIYPDAPRIPMN